MKTQVQDSRWIGAIRCALMIVRAPSHHVPVLCVMPDEDSAREVRQLAVRLIREVEKSNAD